MNLLQSTDWELNGDTFEIKIFQLHPNKYVGKAFKDGKQLNGESLAGERIYERFLNGEVTKNSFFSDLREKVQYDIVNGLIKTTSSHA